MPRTPDILTPEMLVAEIGSSTHYRQVSPDLIRTLAVQELGKRRSYKETVKAIKNKLHQVGGAYLDEHEHYDVWLSMLRDAVSSGDENELRRCCKQVMQHHASTRERLPILDEFYETLFAGIGPVKSILDLACGLQPLALPWMPLVSGGSYYAYDIYQHMMTMLGSWFSLLHVPGCAEVRDLSQHCPEQRVDVAFVLKTLPCLEQIDKTASLRLLHNINARHIIVSFPVRSLGGKTKGMSSYYETHFLQLIEYESWKIRKYVFATELVFVVDKEIEQ